jgi:hypothetical protein
LPDPASCLKENFLEFLKKSVKLGKVGEQWRKHVALTFLEGLFARPGFHNFIRSFLVQVVSGSVRMKDTNSEPDRHRTWAMLIIVVFFFLTLWTSVVDRHHVDADPDPDPIFNFDADPDPSPSFTHVGKSRKNILTYGIHSSWQSFMYSLALLLVEMDTDPIFHQILNHNTGINIPNA